MFITVEGIDGCGKSTQAARLAAALGPEVVLTQEPGGTVLGRAIRGLLLERAQHAPTPEAEVLLYFADRAQHVGQVIRPALAAGRPVVCDRYTDSSLAYQGYGRGLSLEMIEVLARVATGGLKPDLTVFLDAPVEACLARVAQRGGRDRFEVEALSFHSRVRDGYRTLAEQEPRRWLTVDAHGDPSEVEARVRAAVAARGVEFHGLR